MESIANILGQKQPQERRRPRLYQASEWPQSQPEEDNDLFIMASDPEANKYNPPEPKPCPFCNKPMYARGGKFGDRVLWFPHSEQCSCEAFQEDLKRKELERRQAEERQRQAEEAERVRRKIRKIIGESGMRERFLNRTFENFTVTEQNGAAYEITKTYADTFEEKLPAEDKKMDRNGLFIMGSIGVGKTHLVAAIANQLMSQGVPVICMTMIDLLDRIKRTYDKGAISEGEVLKLYETIPLLIIDDMGKEQPTEWGVSKIYTIINSRYEGYMPTIVTTNYDDRALIKRLTPERGDSITAEAIIDRLREMCEGITMTGPSWRSR